MIHPGLCSLTLPGLNPADLVGLCQEAGLTHIEWWGKDHVPVGDRETAAAVGDLTHRAGLHTSTYGSYYRVGEPEEPGQAFEDVLHTALALHAPAIRVWAGKGGSEACGTEQRVMVEEETLRIAGLCAGAGVQLVFEYHGGTLTDTDESTRAFAEAVQHPAVYFGWQPRTGVPVTDNLEGLRGLLPRLATLHVFNWSNSSDGNRVRHPLGEAADAWRRYFALAGETGRDHVALLEFVQGNAIGQFKEDARILNALLALHDEP